MINYGITSSGATKKNNITKAENRTTESQKKPAFDSCRLCLVCIRCVELIALATVVLPFTSDLTDLILPNIISKLSSIQYVGSKVWEWGQAWSRSKRCPSMHLGRKNIANLLRMIEYDRMHWKHGKTRAILKQFSNKLSTSINITQHHPTIIHNNSTSNSVLIYLSTQHHPTAKKLPKS